MKNLCIILCIVFLSCSDRKEETENLPYQETWESLSRFPHNPDFFRDAKFGIYTHWGPVTIGTDHPDSRGGVQWYGENMYDKDNEAYAYHQERFGNQNEIGYKEITKMFSGEKFNADEWAELFAASGAKFAGPVAIHHDNYAMWNSEVTPWNSADQTPKKDFTGELAKAVREKGMMFFTSFHHSYTWGYFINSYQYDGKDKANAALYCEPHDELTPPSRDFLNTWLAMIDEVVKKYEPDMIWFDFGLGKYIPDEYQIRMFANYYNWAAKKNKDVVVFHKHEKIQRYTGVLDFERGRTDKQTKYSWLTDTSLGPWFHDPSHKYYETNQLIDIFIDIISKNGCVLLNVGPKVDGSIPAEAQRILSEIGNWLAINGEGFFKTRPWKIFGEGPTRMKRSGGFSENARIDYTSKDIRFTQSKDGKTIYAFILGWPEEKEIIISSFNIKNELTFSNIKKISILGTNDKIVFSQTEKGLKISVPREKPCDHAFCYKLELR
jgi:alpha-L-fucosidase